jgi:hypothetical protein
MSLEVLGQTPKRRPFAEAALATLKESLYNVRSITYERVPMIQDDIPAKMVLDYRVTSGADQFYWIAGLGVANSILYAINASISFPMGLAVNQLLTSLSRDQTIEMRALSGLAVLLFLGIFVLSGYFAKKGELWAFILGGAVYLFDLVLLIVLGDWFTAAVHGFFLYYIVRGLIALKPAT